MKHEDLQAITKELREISVHVPQHQKALRKRLLAAHTTHLRPRRSFFANMSAGWILIRAGTTKKTISLGVVFVAVVVLGLLLLLPSTSRFSDEKFIASVPKAKTWPTTQKAGGNSTVCGDNGSCTETIQRGKGAPASQERPATVEQGTASVQPVAPLDNMPTASVAYAAPPKNTAIPSGGEPIVSISVDIQVDEILNGKDKTKKDKAAKEGKTSKEKTAKAK